MRSVHADTFNHDHEADGYDDDVHDESHPVRAGYQATLDWVLARAAVQPGDAVIDLGIGTGNLSARLPACRRLVGVDVSARMLELAARKLGPRAELVQSDVLEALAGDDRFDVVISTYAVHHLTVEEKGALVSAVASRLEPGGRFVVGDLMVAGRAAVEGVRDRMRHEDVDALFDEEFPWYVDDTLSTLATAGFTGLVAEQLSELSWGLAARRT
ncbi:MAG TPA: class I SAM-dependent methyltransferase [Acidimicrobiales bacterium]|nr:class I SAM-dependent methyltransferase [Acidimicrobiales bacterium]